MHREDDSGAVVLTIDQFRRLFPPRSRPSREAVRRWARTGTQEGVKLTAYSLDGVCYIEKKSVDAFLNACEIAHAVEDKGTRYAAACDQLRQLGVRF